MLADIWRKILGRKPSDPSNEGGQSKEEGNTRGKRGKKTEEGKKEIGGGANEKGGGNTKKEEEERPFLESGGQSKEEGNTRGKRGEKTEEGKKEIGGGANEKRGGNTKKEEEERPSLESDPNYERHLLDIKIVPENTTPEILKELSDEMDRMCSKYLKNKGMSNHFFDYLKRCHNVMVETLTGGCIKITVQCPTLDSLENLWSATLSGHLDKAAETYLLTSTIKTKLGVDTVKFKVTIKEEDYSACKMSFLQLSGGQKEEEKSKEIEKKTSTGEREGGGTKEIKDAKKEEKEWRFPESGGQKEEEKSEEIEKKTSTVEGEGGGTKEIKDAKKEENQWRSLEFSVPLPKTVTDPTHSKHKPTFQERHRNSECWLDRSEGVPLPMAATDPTPSKHKPTFQERHRNSGCGLERNEGSPSPAAVMDPTPSKHKPTFQEGDRNPERGKDTTVTMQTVEVSTRMEHVNAGSFLKDKIVSKEDIMDVLILHLDRSVCLAPGVPAIQRWEHLADQFKVPDNVKSQCANFSGKLSSSESLFEHLRVTKDSLTVKTVKSYLKKLERNDVVAELEKNSHLKDESTVTDLYEKHSETLCSICMKLDDKRSIRNWYHFGIEIGIEAGTLRRLRDPSRDSPSEMVLEIIKTRKPRHPLKTLAADINLPGVTEALAGFPDNSTIETLLGNMDAMQNVTALLDLNRKWKNVGQHYHINQRILDNLEPSDFQSPTKTVLEYIVNREPTVTMDTFLRFLQNIDRSDVIDDLKEFFYADDIEKILRAGGPLPS